ncbi:MAG: glutamine--tRNA ligase, partial [Bacteroidetes bacterium]|nr:glutamine--tRNA ligase [Bacteroidota bacterium]
GWDDPRMPTIAGFRRRGYTAASIKNFCDIIGVAKRDSTIDVTLLEYSIREDLNKHSQRSMAVLNPLKVVITNYPEGNSEECTAVNNPEDENSGTRQVPFSRELYIDQEDFREVPPPKYYRLSPGMEVRLKYAYIIKFESIVKDAQGNVTEVHCTYDPETKSGMAGAGRKVKATIHWVSAAHAKDVEVRLYDRLFVKENPDDAEEGKDFLSNLNPNSLQVLKNCKVEPMLGNAKAGEGYQFERTGYFSVDPKDSQPGTPVFNRVVTLKDTWAKIEQKHR